MTSESTRLNLMVVMTTVIGITGLRLGYPVIMPLIVAIFVIATAWPIKNWLDARMPTALSYVGTVVILLTIFLGFVAIVYYATAEVARLFYERQDEFRALYNSYANWAQQNGLPIDNTVGGFDRLLSIARAFLAELYTVLSYLGLIAVIVVLGLPEVPALVRKLKKQFARSENREIFEAVVEIAANFRSYLTMTLLTSLITGVASACWAFAVGLELAFIWGILNFMLNFIPVVGSIAGIIPPTLYALVQYDGWLMPTVVFFGFAVLQLFIGNFVYPMMQARGVAMPPIIILLSLLFWGWLWGFAGALLAVPLTTALVVVGRHFESTRKLSLIMTQDKSDSPENNE